MSALVEASWPASASSSWNVLAGERLVVVEGRGDLLGKLLAQLDAPLVIGVKTPDRALDEGDVLVQSDELAQRVRGQPLAEDAGGRAVAEEDASGNDLFGRALGAHLVSGLAKGQSLGLGEEVAQEELVHVLAVALDGVGAVDEGDEVGRNHAGALVNQLVEGMLAVGAGLAPEDLARIGRDGRAVPARGLAVGFHGQLLQVRREAVQVLVTYGSTAWLSALKKLTYHTLMRPISATTFSSSGAVSKVRSRS